MESVVDKINQFRKANGVDPVYCWNPVENDNCESHAFQMARCGELYHAPDYLRPGKAEAVGKCSFMNTEVDTVGHIVFEQFGKSSEGHREILLMPNLAYGLYTSNWQVYLVVRGWI